MHVIFGFLEAADGICSAPIERKSPSPATTIVFKSGLEVATPKAIGKVHP